MTRATVIALLGAESTGKTTLARELAASLVDGVRRIAVVPEYLREFCDLRGRTPERHEQPHIADEQTRRIDAAAATHDVVIADTTALMIAVYSEQVFGDSSLYEVAVHAHRRCDLTLLTALDLPWQADGLQRDGPQVREPVDTKVRAALASGSLSYSVVFGRGDERLRNALASVQKALTPLRDPGDDASPRWQWVCERCGDAGCERHWLARG
jgi:nicotinamide riboside kinase